MHLPQPSTAGILATMALTVAATFASPATAVPITGGTTTVALASAPALAAAGVSVTPFGTATVNAAGAVPVASFPITGGTSEAGALLIEHVGSGLNLTVGAATASVRNFLVDTANARISSDAFANGTFVANIPLFTIGAGLGLSLTSQGAGALTTVLGLPNLAGTAIGTAATTPQVAAVAEPASFAVLLAGIGSVMAVKRRRKAQRATA